MTALPALTSTAARISHATALPRNAFTRSTTELTASRSFN
jgi:hypothetical protein